MENLLKIYVLKEGADFLLPRGAQRSLNSLCRNMPRLLDQAEREFRVRLCEKLGEADFALYPYVLEEIHKQFGWIGVNRFIATIKDYRVFARKAVFFFNHDCDVPFEWPSVFVRSSVSRKFLSPNTIAFPYGVSVKKEELADDPAKGKYHTSFVGYVGSSPLRFAVLKSFYARPHSLRFLFDVTDQFHGHTGTPEARWALFKSSIENSETVLCPRGTGQNSARFFQTMALGRIPVLIGDDCVLPFEEVIDYSKAIFRIPEGQIENAPLVLAELLAAQSRQQILQRGQDNRQLWETHCTGERACAHVLRALDRYRRKFAATLDDPFLETEEFTREERLFARIQEHLGAALAAGDDVNAILFLLDLKAARALSPDQRQCITDMLAQIRSVLSQKNRLQTDYLKLSAQNVQAG